MFRIRTITLIQIIFNLVPEIFEVIVIEEAILEYLCHACHLCIYRISRQSLIKRVVILHLSKLFLSLW